MQDDKELIEALKSNLIVAQAQNEMLRRDAGRANLAAIILGLALTVAVVAFSATTFAIVREHTAQMVALFGAEIEVETRGSTITQDSYGSAQNINNSGTQTIGK